MQFFFRCVRVCNGFNLALCVAQLRAVYVSLYCIVYMSLLSVCIISINI